MIKDVKLKNFKNKGRGIIALKNFKKREIVEVCPIIPLTPKERKRCENTVLDQYIYPWRSTRGACMVLGYGSIYNHSFEPNADWKQNFRTVTMVYRAIKNIKKGEEITVNYNGEPDDRTPIEWFEVK
ncbi:MAG: SET domain-containing protein [Candidatus Shapirobacteria bacterium]